MFPWFRVAVLAALLAAEGWVLWRWGVATLGQWLSLAGGGGVTAACVVWVVRGLREWHSGIDPSEDLRLDRVAKDLAMAVRRTWLKEAAHRGLTSPLPIAVQVRPADLRMVAHPSQWAAASRAVAVDDPEDIAQMLTGTVVDIVDLYNRVTTGRLVIVGAPGGGKTSAAVLLLLALYGTPRAEGRIPVWLPLGSWDPQTTSVEQWMAGQIVATYGTPPAVARVLADSGRILPILDGLDEIPAELRPMALAALRSLDATPLVITCRTTEYAQAAADFVLDAAAVVEVVPVDPSTAADYLTHSGTADTTRWDPVVAALHAPVPNPCQDVLRNPLMLSLARVVYRSPASDPGELTIQPTVDRVEARLLDGLIPAVFGRDLADIRPEVAVRWLSFFADHLSTLGPRAIGWWRLPRCVPRRQLRTTVVLVYGLIGVAVGLLAWAAFVLTAAIPSTEFATELQYNLSMLPTYMLAYSLVCGVSGAFTDTAPMPARWLRPRPKDLTQRLVNGLKVGLASGTLLGALGGVLVYGTDALARADWSMNELLGQAIYGLVFGLALGLVVGVAAGLTASFSQQQFQAPTPLSAFKTDIRAGLASGLVAGLTIELAGTLLVEFNRVYGTSGFAAWFAHFISNLPYALPLAIGGFVWFASRRCASWPYGFAVALLTYQGAVPPRPLRFLEDAYRRGVLRQAGMVYEFRHARLAERLRSRPQDGGAC